jgi:Na+-transporting NADH:ubiquinone oxidoreductase subunit F
MTFLLPALVFGGILVGLAAALTVAEKLLVNYGVCKIDINSGDRELEVDGGQSLLSALNESKVFIPSACGGRGSCGYCKATVLEGGGPLLPTEAPFLTRSEIRSGVRLACQVKVREDIRIKIPEDFLNVKQFAATVASMKTLTHDMVEATFVLEDPTEIEQRAGQYIQITAPSSDGPVQRAYSISSPPSDAGHVQIVVRLVPDGIGSTYIHNLEEGEEVSFTGPYGEFRLNEDPDVEVVCVGGGSGMAPLKNVILTVLERWPERKCWLFFGCRGESDVFYLEQFEQLAEKHPNFKVVYALSEPEEGGDWTGDTGFIHLSLDKHLEGEDEKRQAFLCGPPPMIEAVMMVLETKGLKDENIFYDKF